MNVTNLFDLIANCPNPAPAGVVPYYDGCNWTLISIPADISCPALLACITNEAGFLGTLLTSTNGSITIAGNNIEVNVGWLQSAINVSLVWYDLTVGTTIIDLSTIFSGIEYHFRDSGGTIMDVGNWDTINLLGIDGMRVFITPANTVSVGLPASRQHMQVLTWDAVNAVAYWNNNQCCAQTLAFDTATNILSISGTNSVDLTSINTDNQELDINGNILSITQLNAGPQMVDLGDVNEHTMQFVAPTNLLYLFGSSSAVIGNENSVVDLSSVNEHTLFVDPLNPNLLSIIGSDWVVNGTVNLSETNNHYLDVEWAWTCSPTAGIIEIVLYNSNNVEQNRVPIPKPEVTCCADVMACAGIQAILSELASIVGRVQSLENQIQVLQGQLP